MRAIIISDADSKALLDKLELIKMREFNKLSANDAEIERINYTHRVFHYVVVQWLQEQGAEVIR